MTIGGALSDLNNMLKAEDIPFYYKPSIKKVIETIEQDAIEQRIGHWIFVDKANEHAHCSECDYGNVDLLDGRPHSYCPNCGAKMQEVEE